ncbi:MAG: hypothetical protein KAJ19_22200 [Gammaproteobacteria bacterium]|nr:hypothetical protein [Gammaproteobacteria bacterium]
MVVRRALVDVGGEVQELPVGDTMAEAATTFADLTDTPANYVGAANEFVRVNATPDALTFFDLFAAANTWSGTNDFDALVTMGASIQADAAFTHDIGDDTVRFDRVCARHGGFADLSGVGVINTTPGRGGVITGRAAGPLGTSMISMTGNYPPVLLAGNSYSSGDAGSSSTMIHQGGGGTMIGSAFTQNAGAKTARMYSSNNAYGSFTGGYAFAFGAAGSQAQVENIGAGAFIWAYPASNGGNTHRARVQGQGCVVMGRIVGTGTGTLRGLGHGAFVQGFLSGAGTMRIEALTAATGSFCQGATIGNGSNAIETLNSGTFAQGLANTGSGATGAIRAANSGAFAQGLVHGASTALLGPSIQSRGGGSMAQGSALANAAATAEIEATVGGAFAQGYAYGNAGGNARITASGYGSSASGYAQPGTVIEATQSNSFQEGIGSNVVVDSSRWGIAGLHAKHTDGAFALQYNGQMWMNGTLMSFRSDGVDIVFDQSPAFTPTNVTTDRAFDANSTTIDELADVLGTLIADLQVTGLLG